MQILELADEEAFKDGSDLWIVPDFPHSSWAKKIDWYLNFQFVRGGPHRLPTLSSELMKIVHEWEFDVPEIEVLENPPLLVSSGHLLPVERTIQLPFSSDIKSWVKRCHDLWDDLQRPRLRVFLPAGITPDQFEAAWPQPKASGIVGLVPEP